ncbi:hypothetical protein [Candidatus Pantoea floridensis]|uniref:hypothetical protein n=1 Tax=Candidatus Pantoea floridensis TaxID=1938870 RepID=UPI0015964C11|nr:hypothetical protein [Pantoea floridensis]
MAIFSSLSRQTDALGGVISRFTLPDKATPMAALAVPLAELLTGNWIVFSRQ